MGFYGTPENETKHFHITKADIEEVKKKWRESKDAKNEVRQAEIPAD